MTTGRRTGYKMTKDDSTAGYRRRGDRRRGILRLKTGPGQACLEGQGTLKDK